MANRNWQGNKTLTRQAPREAREEIAPTRTEGAFYGQLKQSQYVSQLHDPDDVAKYEQLMPGATEILFKEFQAQGEHRRYIEKIVVEGNVRQQDRGPMYGMVIVVLALGVGTLLTILGFGTVGIATLITALAAPLTVFITGRAIQRNERVKKDQNA